jgi:hypothetical protein
VCDLGVEVGGGKVGEVLGFGVVCRARREREIGIDGGQMSKR